MIKTISTIESVRRGSSGGGTAWVGEEEGGVGKLAKWSQGKGERGLKNIKSKRGWPVVEDRSVDEETGTSEIP